MKARWKILLVDDDVEFVEGVKTLLEAQGCEVYTAHSGAAGIEKARAVLPHLLILDVMMTTDTDGIETSRKIQSMPELKGLPVILMTGIRKALSLPFGIEPDSDWLPVRAVLEKPVPPEKLLEEVARQLT